jgi:type IV pilus assembly protein PilA
MAMITPITVFAANPQVEQNTRDIAEIKTEQTVQNKQINALKTHQSVQDTNIEALQAEQVNQGMNIETMQVEQVQQNDRIGALELTDAVPGPQGPPGPPGAPGSAPPDVSLAAAQMHTALDLTSGLRWLISDHYRRNGIYAADNATAGAALPEAWSNPYVESASVFNGMIEILFRDVAAPEIAGSRLFLLPQDPGSAVVWYECFGDGFNDTYLAELNCLFSDPPYEPVYTIRRQVQSAIDLLTQSDAQQSIQNYYNQNGSWPTSNQAAGLGLPDQYQNLYVTVLQVTGAGVIETVFGGATHLSIQNQILTWIPIDNGASIQWDCYSVIPEVYLPDECHN